MARRSGSPSLLPLLRSKTQAGLLERLLGQPGQSFTVAELAQLLDVTEMSVRRELERMRRAGIIDREMVGRQSVFHASTASPLYEPLAQLIERSVGAEALLRERLEGVPGVRAAAIFGSWARGEVDADSDVDLLVIGDFDYQSLVSRVMPLQERLGREITLVALSPGELRANLAEGSGFAREVASSPMRVLVGDLRDELPRDA